ncbi:hypothetical protein EDC56_1586 [Sinobacterium caligoides]|uniref:Uncharacterized protein n=1 Tax=Sinobacterium caligoides TaxID=933926 RepID=A0A3N2DMX8_9GAMM|nr:hypothetical protein [Sinobacterium caligoides]ROS01158.1 hypothetical protein EDC56_1586 [Sinobacterium caligoides]
MRCCQCEEGEVRLVRYQAGLEVWACRQCDYESPVLDCHTCERRLVRKQGNNSAGHELWSCYNCAKPKLKCPSCRRGWVMHRSLFFEFKPTAAQGEYCCDHCDQSWLDEEAIGGMNLA